MQVAAAIARSGRQAGEDLARYLAEYPVARPKPPARGRRSVRWADEEGGDLSSELGPKADHDGVEHDEEFSSHRDAPVDVGTDSPTPPPGPPVVTEAASTEPVGDDPAIGSIGVPRAGLPALKPLIEAIETQLGRPIPEDDKIQLMQRLLSNYPYLLGTNDPEGTSGLMVPLGSDELLITLDPTGPEKVANPAGFHSNETINAAYATGAHGQSQGAQTSRTSGALSLSFVIGAAPNVRFGPSVVGVANQSYRSTSHVADAEGGHVEDNRGKQTLLAYTPNWSFKIRTNPNTKWAATPVRKLADPGPEKLLIWVPEHYLGYAPKDQIIATGESVKSTKLPATFYASGLTNIPRLFDEIVATLSAQGLTLPIGSAIREELLQKLWNLNTHLDEAVNDLKNGCKFTLHDKHGRPQAMVKVHTERLPDGTVRVGETSDKSHLENVGTAIDGTIGVHTMANSSTFTPLNVAGDVLPNPLGLPELEFGVSTSVSYTSSRTDAISAGRVGLDVRVSRFVGDTAAYRMRFRHSATVSVRRGGKRTARKRKTGSVEGVGLVRTTVTAAYEHGLPVDRTSLKEPPAKGGEVPYTPNAVIGTGPHPDDPDTKQAPEYVTDGKGIGMGLAHSSETTVEQIRSALMAELGKRGFVPANEDDPFEGRHWYSHGNELDSQLDNLDLLEKMVSPRGLDSHYNEIRNDGMTFTLRKRRGFAGADFDIDAAKITIKAKPSEGKPPKFLRSTDEYHLVNLWMGMDSTGMSSGHTRKVAWGVKFKALSNFLKASMMGIELQRTVGASDSVSFLNNRPELLEAPNGGKYRADEFELTSDYVITIEYQHSGQQGKIGQKVRDPEPTVIKDQAALAHLLPLGNGPAAGPTSTGDTPPEVLDQGVVYHFESTGLRGAVAAALTSLTGPSGMAGQDLSTFGGNIEAIAHLKEILNGEYMTDRMFEPGIFRDTFGGVNVAGRMGPSTFVEATESKFVLGIIKLWLVENRLTDLDAKGLTWDQLDLAFGGEAGRVSLTGEADLNRHWQRNHSKSSGRTGGRELIQLDFNRVYLYETDVYLDVDSRQEKHSKVIPSGRHKHAQVHMPSRRMLYLLSEPEALTKYAEGILPISDAQLSDALYRWSLSFHPRPDDADPPALRLSGDLVAKILTRWMTEVPTLPPPLDTPDAQNQPDVPWVGRDRLVQMLADLHTNNTLPVADSGARDAFNTRFGRSLPVRENPLRAMEMPENLTRDDPGGRMLGHSGVYALNHDNKKSTYEIVKEQIEKVAPGMLAAGAEIWDSDRRVIGRVQGGVDALQSLLARGRDQAMWEDVLSKNGQSFYLVNTSEGIFGWFTSDVVEINLKDVLTSAPEVHDLKLNTGLENYGHGYSGNSTSNSRDVSQAFTFVKFAAGGTHGGGSVGLRTSEGHHRGTTRSEAGVTEQTVYDWSGHYRVRFRRALTVTVRRIKMLGRPLNHFLNWSFKRWTGYGAAVKVTVAGSLELEVPRAMAEAGVLRGPAPLRNFVPMPELPGDAYVAGAQVDSALPALHKVLGDMFGPGRVAKLFGAKANDPDAQPAHSVAQLMSRSHWTNHIQEASGGKRYQVARNLHLPGNSSQRATITASFELVDLEVLSEITQGTGTGRYSKHQSGTTTSSSTDRAFVVADYGVDFNGTMGDHVPPNTWDLGNSGGRATSANQASAGTENYRREQHAKEQGPVYLVRLRVRGRLDAEKTIHHLFREPTPKGTYRSDPITGDVYVEIFVAQLEELRAQLAQATANAPPSTKPWPAMDNAPTFDLAGPLADAAKNKLGAARAYQGVADHIRTRVGGDRPVVLTADKSALIQDTYRSVLRWAVRTMRADLAEARQYDPAVMAPRRLERYQQQVEMLPEISGFLNEPVEDAITSMINEVNRLHDLRPDNPAGTPAALPPEVAVLGLDPVYLGRDVAHELNAHVRVDVIQKDGSVRRRWIGPDGRIEAFSPGSIDKIALSADAARDAGLFPESLHADAIAFGLDAGELGTIYQTSWARQQTFEQTVATELGDRRGRLESVNVDLPELFDRAGTVQEFWQGEAARLEQHIATLSEQDLNLTRRLADARRHEQAAAQVAADLRGLARQADDGARRAWNEVATDRIGDLESAAEALTAQWMDHGPEGTIEPAARLDEMKSADERLLITRAYRAWSEATTVESLRRLERDLLETGEGSVSLVVTTSATGEELIAANRNGRIRWVDRQTGQAVNPPVDAPFGVSLDLGPDGTVLNPSDALREMEPGAAVFRRLRASSASMVPDDLALGEAHLYAAGDLYSVAPGGLEDRTWQHVGVLSDYSPAFWLTHGMPDRKVSVEDLVTDLAGAATFLAESHVSRGLQISWMLRATGRSVRGEEALPDDPPESTLVWFRDAVITGVARMLGDGRYRVYLADQDPHDFTPRQLGEMLGEQGTYLIARPMATVDLANATEPDRPEPAPDRTVARGREHVEMPEAPRARPPTGRSADGQAGSGTAPSPMPGSAGRHPLDTWLAYAPVYWLTRDAPPDGVAIADVPKANLDKALSFVMAGPTDDARRVARLFADTGRAVDSVDALPEDLPAESWIWFSGVDFTGAAVVLPGRRYRIYVPGVQGTGDRSDRWVRYMIGQTPYRFVIGLPENTTVPAPAPGPASGVVSSAAPPGEAADPIPPWYVEHGALGDGTISAVEATVDGAVEDWIGEVTAGLKAAAAGAVRRRILALLNRADVKSWETLLRSGALILRRGARVSLRFSVEEVRYAPPSGEPAEPGLQVYFSKYGDTSYSEGTSHRRVTSGNAPVDPLLLLANGAWSHASPSVKFSAESEYGSGRGIAMEVQSGNRVIANATHDYTARIRVRAIVNRRPRPELLLPGMARLEFPTAYASPAEILAPPAEIRDGGHPTVRVVRPEVLQGLDHAINAVAPDPLSTGLRGVLEAAGLPDDAVDELVHHAAEEYFNEKTLKDRSQWWLTGSWVSGLLAGKLPYRSGFRGHLEISGEPRAVRYVTTTDGEVLIRNDIADTVLFRDGDEHHSRAGIAISFGSGLEIGEHLAAPGVQLPILKSSTGHVRTVVSEGQAKNAIMRKDRLVRYLTEFTMTVTVRSSTHGDRSYIVPILGELGIGLAHAGYFERQALGGRATGSGVPLSEAVIGSASEVVAAPGLPAPREPGTTGRPTSWSKTAFGNNGVPSPFPDPAYATAVDVSAPKARIWYTALANLLRKGRLNEVADYLGDGRIPQIQLTHELQLRLATDNADDTDQLRQVVDVLKNTAEIPVVAIDGSRLSRQDGRRLGVRPPQDRFIIDEDGRARGPLPVLHHAVHLREPIELAARKGLGPGIVRETPGLEQVLREVRDALAHQMRSAGADGRLSADDRQHLARVLSMKFGVPGLRGAYPALISGGISHEETVGDHVFTVVLEAQLRALRRDPVAETGVTLDAQHKGVASLSTTEQAGIQVGGRLEGRFRVKFTDLFSLDVHAIEADARRAWNRGITDTTGVKEYRRAKTSGGVTRFEYETVYALTVTTRRPDGAVAAAQVRELSGGGYWTAVTVANEYLPDKPIPYAEIFQLGQVDVQGGALGEREMERFASRLGADSELDLNKAGLSGIQAHLIGLDDVSAHMADLVTEHNGSLRLPKKADAFQQVLARLLPSGTRYGVGERILRAGTSTFLEPQARRMISPDGLAIPLPSTEDGHEQEITIRLRIFNARHEKALTGPVLEQYTEADLRFGHGESVTNELAVTAGAAAVFRIGAEPAIEGDRTTSQKSSSQILGGITGGGGLSRESYTSDMGGALDLNLGTYTGRSHQYGADAVYTLTHRRWRGKRSDSVQRNVKITRGVRLLVPHVRAVDQHLEVPPGDDLPPDPHGRRYYLDRDLAAAVAYVEAIDAAGVAEAIEDILGDADPAVLRAIRSVFSEEAIRAQYGVARTGGINQVFKSPVPFWRNRTFREYLKIPSQVGGTVRTGVRVTIENERETYKRPRPDVKVTTGGQAFIQKGFGRGRGGSGHIAGYLHGRGAAAGEGLRGAVGVHADYVGGRSAKVGTTTTVRDIRRATAHDGSQEFDHDITFRIEVYQSISPNELYRQAGRLASTGPLLVELVSGGESRRRWRRWFPPGRAPLGTRSVRGRASVVVPAHLTTTIRPAATPAVPVSPAVTRVPVPEPSPLSRALAEHVQLLATPQAQELLRWAPAAAVPWRRVDRQAAANGTPPVADGFTPGSQDGLTIDLALNERDLRANVAALLTGTYRIPLLDGTALAVRMVPANGRWLTRGGYTALNFPEDAAEPERESEAYRGGGLGLDVDFGHPAGEPLSPGAEPSLLDGGASHERGRESVRKIKKNSTGDYVESNRQREGEFDYYVFDVEYIVSGPHGHIVIVKVADGFKGILPTVVAHRLAVTGLEPPRPAEQVTRSNEGHDHLEQESLVSVTFGRPIPQADLEAAPPIGEPARPAGRRPSHAGRGTGPGKIVPPAFLDDPRS